MNTTTVNTSSLGTAAGSGGAAYAFVTLITWVISFAHVTVPDNVSNALLVLITIGIHYVVSDKKKETVVTSSPASPNAVIIPTSPTPGVSQPPGVMGVSAGVATQLHPAIMMNQPSQIG